MRSATFVWMRRRDSASDDTNNVVLRACRHFNQSPRTRLVNCTVSDSRLHSTLLSNGIDDVVGYAVRYSDVNKTTKCKTKTKTKTKEGKTKTKTRNNKTKTDQDQDQDQDQSRPRPGPRPRPWQIRPKSNLT